MMGTMLPVIEHHPNQPSHSPWRTGGVERRVASDEKVEAGNRHLKASGRAHVRDMPANSGSGMRDVSLRLGYEVVAEVPFVAEKRAGHLTPTPRLKAGDSGY